MDTTLRRLPLAYDMAVRAHEGQTRRAGRGEPYVNHVADVARRVCASAAVDETTLLSAVLHDVVEKTDRTLAEVEVAFGTEVAGVVAELTDGPSLPEAEQWRMQVELAGRMSERAGRIKLADKASKMASIAEAPPGWPERGEARAEVEQARLVADRLRGLDAVLEAARDREAVRAEAALGA